MKYLLIYLTILIASCSKSNDINQDIKNSLGDAVYYSDIDTPNAPKCFSFENPVYVSDYVVYNYNNEKVIVNLVNGSYVAYCGIEDNKYSIYDMNVKYRTFILTNANETVVYKKQ